MVRMVSWSRIWTIFEADIIHYHNEVIPGYILRYGATVRPGDALSLMFDPSLPTNNTHKTTVLLHFLN